MKTFNAAEAPLSLLSRREWLTAGALTLGMPWSARTPAATVHDSTNDGRLTTPDHGTVMTRAGRVQGFELNGVYVFKGVPYGADTGGAARFLPPRPTPAWDGIRRTLSYGPVSPQPIRDHSNDILAFFCDWDDGYASEDCLRVNVWSAQLDPGARRPVMFWMHGGGFTAGSSQELPSYDGENLARQGVVVVSVNHRLGPLGYLDLSELDNSLGASGNVGMLDLVLALQWVRDNIAQFGGDPERVTIFGQSGGGAKVSALMAMPDARGLFHRAIIMSGSFPTATSQSSARACARALCGELGIRPSIEALRGIDTSALIGASVQVVRRGAPGVANSGAPRVAWEPVIDGKVLPEAWETRAPSLSAHIPLMIGSVRDEIRTAWHLSEEQLLPHVAARHPRQAAQLIAAVRTAYPGLSSTGTAALIDGMGWRVSALDQARKQHALGGAPVYSYWYVWSSPLLDGAIGVPHTADIAAAFDNIARCDQLTGNAPEAHVVARVMSQAFVAFATRGDPSIPGHPWPAYSAESLQTMVYDAPVRVERDPLGDVRRLLSAT